MSRRPELELIPPEIYYGDDTAAKYHVSSRVRDIQRRMTERALTLLALPQNEPCLLLDIGAGTGLAGEVLQASGHTWVGTDISRGMLKVAKRREFDAMERFDEDEEEEEEEDDSDDDGAFEGEEEEEEDDLPPENEKKKYLVDLDVLDDKPQPVEVMQHDMGTPLPFRPGSFDGAISISALQWLCNIDKKGQIPQRRLRDLFQSLFNCLRRGARAVFQFYPVNPQQTAMISTIATRCGFGGGVVVDYPHSSRARKYYLVIYAGLAPAGYRPPRPLGEEQEDVDVDSDEDVDNGEYFDPNEDAGGGPDQNTIRMFPRQKKRVQQLTGARHRAEQGSRAARPKAGSKAWVLMKKEQSRKFGNETRPDSKYTARKRKDRF